MESQGKRLCVSATNARAFSSPAFSGSSRSACDAIVLPLLPPVMLAASNVPEQCQAKRMSRGARLPSSCFRSPRRLAMSFLTPRRSRDAGLETPAAAIAVNGETYRRCPPAQMRRGEGKRHKLRRGLEGRDDFRDFTWRKNEFEEEEKRNSMFYIGYLASKSHQRQQPAGGRGRDGSPKGCERSTVSIREIVTARWIVGRGLGPLEAVWPANLRTVALARDRAATRRSLHKSEGAASH